MTWYGIGCPIVLKTRGARARHSKKNLAAARKAPYPKMISIQKYIKSKPEKAYLDWKTEQKKKQK